MRRRPPSFAASQRQVSSVESHPSKPPPYALEFLLSPCWFAHAKQIFGLSSAPSLFHATVLAAHLLLCLYRSSSRLLAASKTAFA